ncbi:hypothetical protein [Leifsonia sp. Leaf264]|uniref:hypothetical protein n=1 Tax=Leifsonia sp. Leaf264 TaxID=1736314 RepID=UPI0007012345|nr:hypothetical protein [Leifsonia sp. Leaf264]KQO97399.1 hypothetical protein ASF30_13190 [Leifsonia sp. Leaf264]
MGLVEIIVAVLLLAVVALCMFPLFANTMQLSRTNILVARAAQIVNTQTDLARQQAKLTATCVAMSSLSVATPTAVPAMNAEGLTYTRTVSTCPAVYPATMQVGVRVFSAKTGEELASARALVVVTAAS